MATVEEQELVTEVTRQVLAAQFPEELPLLRVQSQAYFEDPEVALQGKAQRGEGMLAFGAGEAVTLITPIALAVVGDLVPYLLEQVRDSIKSESEPFIQKSVRRLFKKLEAKEKKDDKGKEQGKPKTEVPDSPEPPTEGEPAEQGPLALSSAQVKEVRARAVEKAKALGLEAAKAELLADAIAGSLRTS